MHKNSSHKPSLDNPIPPLGSVKKDAQVRNTPVQSLNTSTSAQFTPDTKKAPSLTAGEVMQMQLKQCCTALIFVVLLALLAFIAVLKMHGFSYGQV